MSKAMTSVESELTVATARDIIDQSINDFFTDRITQARMIDKNYASLWQSMHTLARAGSKRIRSYITLLTYSILSGKPIDVIVPIATAQELLHLSLLIHDDIIDRDYVRYGVANISGHYDTLYAPFIPDAAERRHFSDSAALLAGDLLLSGGYQMIQSSQLSPEDQRTASDIFGHAIFIVAGGELLDTESAFRNTSPASAVSIARLKTAHYSLVTPLTMGATLAGADNLLVAQLAQFGEKIGIAYQMVDDLLGVFGNELVTGKSNVSDIQESKHTYLIEQCRKRMSSDQLKRFNQLFGKTHITFDQAEEFRNIIRDSGAKDAVEATIEEHFSSAIAILNQTTLSATDITAFELLAERITKRER